MSENGEIWTYLIYEISELIIKVSYLQDYKNIYFEQNKFLIKN